MSEKWIQKVKTDHKLKVNNYGVLYCIECGMFRGPKMGKYNKLRLPLPTDTLIKWPCARNEDDMKKLFIQHKEHQGNIHHKANMVRIFLKNGKDIEDLLYRISAGKEGNISNEQKNLYTLKE